MGFPCPMNRTSLFCLLILKYGISSICPKEQEKLCVAGPGGVDAAGAELPQLQTSSKVREQSM
jgi:hypothetical protein